jgi:hypothetical protein
MLVVVSTKPKKLLVMALWVILSTLALLIFLASSSTSANYGTIINHAAISLDTYSNNVKLEEHPIKTLVRKAGIELEAQLARQSKSYHAAASEYLRRYGRNPPPGFEAWYQFAMRHGSLIIDDFDIINETLTPFWSLSGAEVKRRLHDIRDNGPMIWHCESSDGQLSDGCENLGGELLRLLRSPDISPHLPEVDMLINALDEPRVLAKGVGDRDSSGTLGWTDFSQQNVWHKVTAECRKDIVPGPLHISSADRKYEADSTSFFSAPSDALDLCHHSEYSRMHGIWRSPTSLKITQSAVPILSPAVLSTMGDIPFPAAAYTDEAYTYAEIEDIFWESKAPGLYWAGKTTGSFQKADSLDWKQHHRQRFVSLVDNLGTQIYSYLKRPNEDAAWQRYNSSIIDGSLYNVHFTGVVQCEDTITCDNIQEYFDIREPEPRSEAFKYTLVFDLDGNGHSGRFYRLLTSRSLPLKQTVFREWHDERLQPWQHYVPISLEMDDLPEVVRYLVDEEEGRQIAAQLAEMGRQWSLRALRPTDQVIYIYRLMLELSFLQDPRRSAL